MGSPRDAALSVQARGRVLQSHAAMPDTPEITDEMVRAAAEGTEPERTRVVGAQESRVRGMIYWRLSPPLRQMEALNEIAQEVMLALTTGISRLGNCTVCGLRAFVSQIVQHKVCDYLDRRKPHADGSPPRRVQSLDSTVNRPSGARPLRELLPGSGTSPSSAAARSEQFALLMSEFEQLKPRYREVITLVLIDQLPWSAVAARLRISERGARRLLERALLTLRHRMTEASSSR